MRRGFCIKPEYDRGAKPSHRGLHLLRRRFGVQPNEFPGRPLSTPAYQSALFGFASSIFPANAANFTAYWGLLYNRALPLAELAMLGDVKWIRRLLGPRIPMSWILPPPAAGSWYPGRTPSCLRPHDRPVSGEKMPRLYG
jgi:hypothetical protein